jgi:tryptophanyl-tRNA synthetase
MQMQTIFSGVQPTGTLTLGNYLGAIRNFVELQTRADCYFCVVDQHAITVPRDPIQLREQTLDMTRLFIACGLDPNVSTLFIQSHVSAHSELAWILECSTYVGELRRMTQFKDKSQQQQTASAGLMTYPVLMAADILLYDATHVPVGDDQKQHLELCRDLAVRFNHRFGDTFVVPAPYIPARAQGGRIMGLKDATKKMAKSDEDADSYILLTDSPDLIRKKVMRAVTDSGHEVRYDEINKPGISNLMVILSLCSGLTLEQIDDQYHSSGYGVFKKEVAEAVVAKLEPMQRRYQELREPGVIEQALKQGAERASRVATRKLIEVKEKVGFVFV